MTKKVIVIDLDGTFVSINTFHHWIRFLGGVLLRQGKILSVWHLGVILLQRLTKCITHAQMKFKILQLSQKSVTQAHSIQFAKSMAPYVNYDLVTLLDKEQYLVILATAAPTIYAKPIAEIYGFDHLIATPATTEIPWIETVREEKQKKVATLLKQLEHTEGIDQIFTDHYDDLPLMRDAQETILVAPSAKTLSIVRQEGIRYSILP